MDLRGSICGRSGAGGCIWTGLGAEGTGVALMGPGGACAIKSAGEITAATTLPRRIERIE
jgi:hypothetical protein